MQPSPPETSATRLAAEDLHRPCDPASLPFDSSADAEIVATLVGQERALEAVRFGISIRREGYNLFAIGPHGVGKQSLLRQYLDPRAADEPTPSDWCFVTHPA